MLLFLQRKAVIQALAKAYKGSRLLAPLFLAHFLPHWKLVLHSKDPGTAPCHDGKAFP